MPDDVFDFSQLEEKSEVARRRETRAHRVQIIERTGKFWKMFQLIGFLGILGSFFVGTMAGLIHADPRILAVSG